MTQYREILRLSSLGFSNRNIAFDKLIKCPETLRNQFIK